METTEVYEHISCYTDVTAVIDMVIAIERNFSVPWEGQPARSVVYSQSLVHVPISLVLFNKDRFALPLIAPDK